MAPRFAVCIPNYNYGRFLGETIHSVIDQGRDDVEICVSDNASTDNSVEVIRSFTPQEISLSINPQNFGFAPNLDRAVSLAKARTAILLSSDDLMLAGALNAYAALLDRVEPSTALVGSALRVVDSDGNKIGSIGAQAGVWKPEHLDPVLSAYVGYDVYSAPAHEILRASLARMCNPFHFCALAYPVALWRSVGGYGGQRLMNPDKWFHWQLLGSAGRAYYIDADFFAYRWHQSNQAAQQRSEGAIKFLVDEYASTIQLDEKLLVSAGIDREQLRDAFLVKDIALRGLRELAEGRRQEAVRGLRFAQATYPWALWKNWHMWLLRAAIVSGPFGRLACKSGFGPALRMWRRRLGVTDSNLYRMWWP